MPRRRAHRTKNIRIADSPCFDLFADHRVSLLRERLLARAEQDCRDQAGRNEKSWAALNDISPPTHPLPFRSAALGYASCFLPAFLAAAHLFFIANASRLRPSGLIAPRRGAAVLFDAVPVPLARFA